MIQSALDRLTKVHPDMEIWWDSSPLVFKSWVKKMVDAGPTGKKREDILKFAQKKGIILRGEKPKYGSEGWFRVTIGTKEENKLFVHVIKEFFSTK